MKFIISEIKNWKHEDSIVWEANERSSQKG